MSELKGMGSQDYSSQSAFFLHILGDEPLNKTELKNPEINGRGGIYEPFEDIFYSPICTLPHEDRAPLQIQAQSSLQLITGKCQECADADKNQLESPTPTDESHYIAQNDKIKTQHQLFQSLLQASEASPRKYKKMGKFILKQYSIKKLTRKFAISKFLARLFFKHQSSYPTSPQIQQYNNSLSVIFQQTRKSKFNMEKDIAKIFGLEEDGEDCEVSFRNRLVMSTILRQHLKDQVILNSFTEQNRLSYMIGSKIYALRTRSRELVKKASFR